MSLSAYFRGPALGIAAVLFLADSSAGRTPVGGERPLRRSAITLRPKAQRMTLDSVPYMTLGGPSDGQPTFDPHSPLLSVVRLTDGGFAVNDRAAIDLFDARGHPTRRIAPDAAGPWDFQQLRPLCPLPHGRLLAIDYATHRRTVWTQKGQFVEGWTNAIRFATQPCVGDGSLIAESAQSQPPSPVEFIAYDRIEPSGKILNRVGLFPADQYRPFIRETTVFATTYGVYVDDGRSGSVNRYALDGKASAKIALHEQVDQPVTGRHLTVDGRNRIWTQNTADPLRWNVFAANGAHLGVIDLTPYRRCRGTLSAVLDTTAVIRCSGAGREWLELARVVERP